ncbi:MAG: hypothetical protein DPW09_17145 [Anaerolineae bacterium]|nr:hypothetical protein [Anaerolineae bacterium]
MEGLSNAPGFLGTGASLLTDINLVVHILMLIVLCLGVAAQFKRKYQWTAFALGILATLAGIGIYFVWYTGNSASFGSGVAEHDSDLVAEHAETVNEAAATQPAAEGVEDHAQEPIVEEGTAALVEGVEEAGEEEDRLVEEHAEEPVEGVTAPAAISAPVRVGFLGVSDGQTRGSKVTLSLISLTPPPAGSVYEAWLEGENEPPFSIGKLALTGYVIDHTFADPDGRNLLGLYDRMFISVEPVGDSDPVSSGTVAYQGEVLPAVIEQVRLVVVASPNTPDGGSLALNAENQVRKMASEAGFQRDYSLHNNDLAGLKIQAEGIINIIEGKTGPNYGDADRNGEIYDPGDGFGLLGPGEGAGYLQAVINAAITASQVEGASPEVKLQAQQVQTAAQNSISWLERIRDLELQILNASDVVSQAGTVIQVVQLIDQLTEADEIDLVTPRWDDLWAMYRYSQAMGTIEIFSVAGPPELIGEHAADAAHAVNDANPPTPELIDEHAADSEHDGDNANAPPVLVDEHAADSEHDGDNDNINDNANDNQGGNNNNANDNANADNGNDNNNNSGNNDHSGDQGRGNDNSGGGGNND